MDKVLSSKVSITLEHCQGLMTGDRGHRHNVPALFEQPRCCLVPKIMWTQSLNPSPSTHGLKTVTDMVVPHLRKNEPIDTPWHRREHLYSPNGQWNHSLLSVFCIEKLGCPHLQVYILPTQAQ